MRKLAFAFPGAVVLLLASLFTTGMAFASPVPAAAVSGSAAGLHQITIYHGGPRIRSDGTASSTNWSGYAVTGSNGAYSDVQGSWVEPSATCGRRQTAYSSFWVGLDGYSSNSVE